MGAPGLNGEPGAKGEKVSDSMWPGVPPFSLTPDTSGDPCALGGALGRAVAPPLFPQTRAQVPLLSSGL